jgi:hypothetical protein
MTLQADLELLEAGRLRAEVLAVSEQSSRQALAVSIRDERVLGVKHHFLLEATLRVQGFRPLRFLRSALVALLHGVDVVLERHQLLRGRLRSAERDLLFR